MANPANTSKELFFTVTLPDSAFISKFLMVIKDKVYEAYVKEKEEAKKDYQDAVSRGETAGHVEQSTRDSNLFTVSVNVEPHNKVTFNLTYEHLLTRTLGQYENVINVNPGQVVKAFQIEVNIEESAPIASLEVPSLKTSNEIDAADSKDINVRIERPKNNTAKIIWNPDIEQQKKLSAQGVKGQLIVRYDIDRSSESNQILVDEGYFVHFFAPPNLKTLNKHVLFVLDISGSMEGRKIEQLREALKLILNDIKEDDFFSLILFSDSIQVWTLDGTVGEPSPSWSYDEVTTSSPFAEVNERFIVSARKENVEKAKAFASTLNETGGTNIIAGLRQSLKIANWGQKHYALKAKPLIVFLTDGQPNVEVSDPEEIIKAVKKLNVDKYPLFSLAFGEDTNYNFLRKLSLSNAGFARNIYVASDTSLQLKNFYKQVASPLLSNVSFEYIPGQVDENTLTKSTFSNLYNGSELVVAGRLTNGSNTLNGNLTGTAFEGYFCAVMPPIIPVNRAPGHLEKLWSYLHIKELLDKDLLTDEKNSVFKQKALNLSLHYGFVTPLTSLVVVKPNETTTGNLKTHESPIENQYPQAISSFSAIRGGSVHGAALYALNAAPSANYFSSSHKSAHKPVNLKGGGYNQEEEEDPMLHYSTVHSNHPLMAFDSVETANLAEPLNISDILWLVNKTEIVFPSSNNSYSIFTDDAPNTEFQVCIVPNSNNTVSHCRHLAHCVLPEILKSFADFVPYGEACVIDARFVGICCPPSHPIQKMNGTATTQNTAPVSSTGTPVAHKR